MMSKNGNTAIVTIPTPADAVTRIAAQYPEEAKVLSGVLARDVRTLGTDEVFALRDGQGEIKAFKGTLTLSLADGTLVQPVADGPPVISAQGYEQWAEAVGASVIFPKEVLVDGQWQQNPAIVRDKDNRRILCIYARAVAFRFSSKGIPQVSDWTTIFDTPSYRLIDLLGKAKKFPQAFRLLPADMGKPELEGTWASYPFDESTALWVNTAHEEALSWFAQILNREKKAIDFAQTFARRNTLKHLSGLQRVPPSRETESEWKGKDGRMHKTKRMEYPSAWTVPILCWRPTSGNIVKWDATRYATVQEVAGRLITSRGDDFASDGAQTPFAIEARTGRESVSDDPGNEALEASVDPEDQGDVIDAEVQEPPQRQAPPEAPPKTPELKLSDEDRKTLMNYHAAREQFVLEHAEACNLLGFAVDANLTPDQARAVIHKIGVVLDAQNIA